MIRLAVSAGGSFHSSKGESLSPWQACRTGIDSPGEKAALVRVNGSDVEVGGGDVSVGGIGVFVGGGGSVGSGGGSVGSGKSVAAGDVGAGMSVESGLGTEVHPIPIRVMRIMSPTS